MARILIVEDEAVLRLTFERFLAEEGHHVEVAGDFSAARAALEAAAPDVVICDIQLPDGSGVDLLREVRGTEPAIAVIMITGQPEVSTAAEAVRLGAFDYLAKPVTGSALKRVVRLALDQKRVMGERDVFEKEMERYRNALETIFNSVSEGIIAVDGEGNVEQINAAARSILNLGERELAGISVRTLFTAAMRTIGDALHRTLGTRNPERDLRVETTISGGATKILICSTLPLVAREHASPGALVTLRDVTRLTNLEQEISERQQYKNIVGKTPRMLDLFQLVRDVAETDSTALICGESGTGKELFAAALHEASPRRGRPFVRVNCAALSDSLLESELFGHVKGAFTGAVRDRRGRFEAARGGTILLDEIGDISPRLQLRLLRVLQEKEFERVGESEPVKSDVRVIASTNRDLRQMIRDGVFREDLFYRLNVVRIDVPPLRERRGDIPPLVHHFIRVFNAELKREVIDVAPDVMELFMRHSWPGNVRELENCVERALIVCRDTEVQRKHLPEELVHSGAVQQEARPVRRMGRQFEIDESDLTAVLGQTDWNIAKAARLLGVARNTLYQRIRALGLARPDGLS